MRRTLVGLTLAVLLAALTAPAAAQDIGLSITWGTAGMHATATYWSGGLHEVGYVPDHYRYVPPPRRVVPRHYAECVADGPYLYCWDTPRFYRGRPIVYGRPVVHVYVTDRAVANRYHPGRHGWNRGHLRQHELAAARYWRHWADVHRYAYDRDRLAVDVALAW